MSKCLESYTLTLQNVFGSMLCKINETTRLWHYILLEEEGENSNLSSLLGVTNDILIYIYNNCRLAKIRTIQEKDSLKEIVQIFQDCWNHFFTQEGLAANYFDKMKVGDLKRQLYWIGLGTDNSGININPSTQF